MSSTLFLAILTLAIVFAPTATVADSDYNRLFLTCGECNNIMAEPGMVFSAPLNSSFTVGETVQSQIQSFCPNPISNQWGISTFSNDFGVLTFSDPSIVLRQNDVICAVQGVASSKPVADKKSTRHHSAKTLSVLKNKIHHAKKLTAATVSFPGGYPRRIAAFCSKQENGIIVPLFITSTTQVSDVLEAVNQRCNLEGTGLYLTGAGSVNGGILAVPSQVLLALNEPAQQFIEDGDTLALIQ